jgi:SAM-dependent methyltransferase
MRINQYYLDNQKQFFEKTHSLMTVNNHFCHNQDPEYWDMLLGEIKTNPKHWEDKVALDFGCGCGRNIKNLLDLANWKQVYGCDISKQNADYSFEFANKFYPGKVRTWENNGKDIQPCDVNSIDFIMSHIVFQHISNHNVRYSLMEDMYKCLKPNGLTSLHYLDMDVSSTYYENNDIFQNCRVEEPEYLIRDFEKIGFKNITCQTGRDYFTGQRNYYIKGYK